jgi:hypothetical protein
LEKLNKLNKLNYSSILSQYDNSIYKSNNSIFNNNQDEQYDIVIVLTVWKRNNLERQLLQIKDQSILKNKKTNIIVFQNSNYINVIDIINKWNKSEMFSEKVNISFIQSPIETGYFGRFIIPLTSSVRSDSYFIICDDDVLWGKRYFENMLRVVDEGSLATRNGRIIGNKFQEYSPVPIKTFQKNIHICYDEDIEYDFGGHTWAGRISWLRKAWNHIPISIENCEDFWISAVLKSYYNIPTKTPKCPCPKGIPIVPDMCAASDKSADAHIDAIVGKSDITHIRTDIIKETAIKFNYQLLISSDKEYVDNIPNKFVFGNLEKPLFNLNDSLWNDALFWQ